jgi:hypothetical protein
LSRTGSGGAAIACASHQCFTRLYHPQLLKERHVKVLFIACPFRTMTKVMSH